MKKKLCLGLITLASVAMLCGFDSAETPDSVLEKMTAAQAELVDMSTEVTANADLIVNLDDGTNSTPLAVNGGITMNMDAILNPFTMKEVATVTYSVLGSGESVHVEAYAMPTEDGKVKLYAHSVDATSGDDAWSVELMEGFTTDMIAQMQASSTATMADLGLTFELADAPEDVNGSECYVLSTAIDSTTIGDMLNKVAELSGQALPVEDISSVLALLTGLKLDVVYYVDTTTFLPVKAHLDMNDSDLTIINTLLSSFLGAQGSEDAPATTASLTLNDLSMDMTASFNGDIEIALPQEALDAEANGETASLTDLAGEAMAAVQ